MVQHLYTQCLKNYPTVTLFPHDLKYLNYETKNVFEGLFNVGICHKDSESLKAFIEKNFHNYSKWWGLQKLKMPNIYFAKYRGRVLPNRMVLLRDILLKEKKRNSSNLD